MFTQRVNCSPSANLRLWRVATCSEQKEEANQLIDWKRDPLVSADRSKFADAYQVWVKRGNRESGAVGPYFGLHSDRSFIDAIGSLLKANTGIQYSSLGLPTTRSGWSNWRNGRSASCIKLNLEVCRAAFEITGVDPTTEQFFMNRPSDFTDMVALGPASIEETSEANNKGIREIKLGWIECRLSQSRELYLADLKPNSRRGDDKIAIGSISCAMQRLRLVVTSSRDIVPLLRNGEVEDEHSDEMNASMQLNFVSSNDRGAPGEPFRLEWSLEPTFPRQALQSSLREVTLCSFQHSSRVDITVELVAEPNDVAVKFSFFRDGVASDGDISWAKRKMIEQILKTHLCGNFKDGKAVISRTKVKMS